MSHSRKHTERVDGLLSLEVSKLVKNVGFVSRCYQDFKRVFRKMNDDSALKRITAKTECAGEVPEDAKIELDHLLNDTLVFVVFGQSQYSKAVIINEILNKQIINPSLPIGPESSEPKWRTVRFIYGSKQSLSLSLPCDNYDLFDNLSGHGKQWNVVPPEDLLAKSENADSAHSSAFLEVTVNHPLLKYGAVVVMTPNYDRTKAEEVHEIYHTSTNSSKCVVLLYAMDNELLSQEDVMELDYLRKVHSDDGTHSAILFTVVPKLDAYHNYWAQRQEQSALSAKFLSTGPLTTPMLKPSLSVDGRRRTKMAHRCVEHRAPSRSDSDDNNAFPYGAQNRAKLTPSPGSMSTEVQPATTGVLNDEHLSLSNDVVFNQSEFPCSLLDVMPLVADLSSLGMLKCFVPMSEFSWQEEIRLSNATYQPVEEKLQKHFRVNSVFVREFIPTFNSKLVEFTHELTRKWLFRSTHLLHIILQVFLQSFVLVAYELAYNLMVTPKKTEFARMKEMKLYEKLLQMTRNKQPELNELITSTLKQLKEDMPDIVKQFHITELPQDRPLHARQYKLCIFQLRQHVLKMVDAAISNALCTSITDLRETYGGAIERCLSALEKNSDSPSSTPTTVQSLQNILKTAYEVRVARHSSSTFVSSLMDKLKELLYTLPWQPGLVIDDTWKQQVASDLLNNISEAKIFRLTCDQISARLRSSHEEFTSALRKLELRIELKNSESEEVQERIRRSYAPRLAKIAFEVISLRDAVLFGVPPMHRELGRGQYGVVYSIARSGEWGPFGNCCVKSLVPQDEKHWQDLALEFFYTSSLPPHERIVRLYGAVIEPNFSGGNPAALLVMERMRCDLHSAMRTNLSWAHRLQVAIDVVEGIRYLHSQGLIHRDIKLKNVLLDREYRAKLTDLGFCKPHAMMSGSVVGTPIHMAPELLRGQYHSSVDVYAFGILFWYICANTVKLPYKFQHYQSKDELWSAVRDGLRPEKLHDFDESCWRLMCQCWHGDPLQRPFPGDVERSLRNIYSRTVLGVVDTTEEIGKQDYLMMERQQRMLCSQVLLTNGGGERDPRISASLATIPSIKISLSTGSDGRVQPTDSDGDSHRRCPTPTSKSNLIQSLQRSLFKPKVACSLTDANNEQKSSKTSPDSLDKDSLPPSSKPNPHPFLVSSSQVVD